MVLFGVSPFRQFLFVGPVPVQVVQHIAQAVIAQRDPSLFRPLSFHRDHRVLAVKLTQAQIAQLGDADAGVDQQPENRAIADRGAFGDRSRFVWGRAGQ